MLAAPAPPGVTLTASRTCNVCGHVEHREKRVPLMSKPELERQESRWLAELEKQAAPECPWCGA